MPWGPFDERTQWCEQPLLGAPRNGMPQAHDKAHTFPSVVGLGGAGQMTSGARRRRWRPLRDVLARPGSPRPLAPTLRERQHCVP